MPARRPRGRSGTQRDSRAVRAGIKPAPTTGLLTNSLIANGAAAILPRPPSNQKCDPGQFQRQRTRFGNGRNSLNGLQDAEESIRLAVGTCCKVDVLATACAPVIARDQAPEAVNGDRLTVGSNQLSQETGCRW